MTSFTPLAKLKYIDGVLSNMRLAGYDLDSDGIAFVWKAARGEASPAEIEEWTATMAARLPLRVAGPQIRHLLDAIATDLQSSVDGFVRQVEELCSKISMR